MRGIPLLEAYASAKAAIVGFTNTPARAVRPHRRRVNAIAPGAVLTERQRQLWFQTEAQVEVARAAQCLPDLIAPDDIANLALFLASDDSRRLPRKTCLLRYPALDRKVNLRAPAVKIRVWPRTDL